MLVLILKAFFPYQTDSTYILSSSGSIELLLGVDNVFVGLELESDA